MDLIDRFAWYVAKDGLQFETAIMAQEAANPDSKFEFVSQLDSPANKYYRWRVRCVVPFTLLWSSWLC